MMPRMGIALIVTIAALLVERMLRLLSFVTSHGSDLTPILALTLNLLPHYLGLALPAAFCFAILASLSTLSKTNEIDALEAAGWSLRRIGAPYIAVSIVLSLISALLFGVVQPYSRFAFSELKHAVSNAGWSGRVEQGVFFDLGAGMTLTAADIDATGRILNRVFIHSSGDGEAYQVTTAKRGVVVPEPEQGRVYLVLRDGRSLASDSSVLEFEEFQLSRSFKLDENPFRPRGGSERELTLFELWDEMRLTNEPRYAVEFHGRLVRAISLIGIALLSVPLAVSRKRAPGWQRITVAVVILALYDNLIKLVSSMSKLDQINPAIGLWGLCAIFIGVGGWLFLSTPGQGARSPFRFLFRTVAEAVGVPPFTAGGK